MKISIIIPIYNSSLFLKACIDSVLQQTYHNFELLLIDDGSTDRSLQIIETYHDARIKIITKPNSGVSDTRNMGIKSATGDYICFIDSDDWVDQHFLQTFVDHIENDNTLLVQNIKRNDKLVYKFNYKTYDLATEMDTLITDNNLLYAGGPVAKFYNRKIIVDHFILFNPDLRYGEDLVFFIDYIRHIKFIKFIEASLYHYRYNENSLSVKNKTISLYNYAFVNEKVINFIHSFTPKNRNTIRYLYTVSWDMIETGIDLNLNSKIKPNKKHWATLRNNLSENHLHHATLNRKLIYFALKLKLFSTLIRYKKLIFKLKNLG